MNFPPLALLIIGSWIAAPPAHAVDFSTQITDATTGEPIAGAVLWKIEERLTPLTGEFWYSEKFTSDSAGLVTGSEELKGDWWFVDAKGYAPRAFSSSAIDPTIELNRGREVTLTLVDVFDEPVRGAKLGWFLGCGHTPDIRKGVTDKNGRVVLSDFDPGEEGEWWPSGKGVRSNDLDPEWNQDRTRGVLRCSPAPLREGLVVGSNGEPLVGVFVGQPNSHRGPWARTDDTGSFQLLGADESEVWVRSPQGEDLGFFPTAIPGHPRVIRVEQPRTRDASLQLAAYSTDSGSGVAIPLTVIRVQDGWNETSQTNSEGRLTLPLANGSYLVQVGGGLGSHELVELRAELGAGMTSTIEAQLVPRPTVRVNLMGHKPNAPIMLATKDEERDISNELDSVSLPSVPCVIWTSFPSGRKSHRVTADDRLPGAVIRLTP